MPPANLQDDAQSSIRHDFDALRVPQKPRVVLRRILPNDFEPLDQLARKAIGGGISSLDCVRSVLDRNANSVLVFERERQAVGLWAMLMLTPKGLEAMIAAELDARAPETSMLVSSTQAPAAIYIWAVVAERLASEGIRHVSNFLRQPLYARSNLYTRAATKAGGEIMIATGFAPMHCKMTGLHRYVRHANRQVALPNPLTVAA